ncbi:MAG: DUF4255 domain-containing protein [Jatrophihabitans sp.]|nr:MAG: DUF4255 domain-containing protein [Jatrophihabitans sp.]
MFIKVVDDALERMLRAELPLPEEIGDVTFDAPTSNWSAQLSRVTVNLFLYDVDRSAHASRSPQRRTNPDGVAERRPALPMVELSYLVSCWAGTSRDEHQLLGDVVSRIAGLDVLPERYFNGTAPGSSTIITFGTDTANKAREIWSSLGGQLKASFTLQVSVAADTFGWGPEAPAVQRVQTLTRPMPMRPLSRSQLVKDGRTVEAGGHVLRK